MRVAVLAALALLPATVLAQDSDLSDSERALLVHARDLLRSGVSSQRKAAAEALTEIGPKMYDAIPDLWSAILDHKPTVRAAVGAALLKVDPEFGGAISSLALNSNIDALKEIPKLGERARHLKPIVLDVICRMSVGARYEFPGPRIGPSTKDIIAKHSGSPLVECLHALVTINGSEVDPQVWRVALVLLKFEGEDYVSPGRDAAACREEVRREAAIALRSIKRPPVNPKPKPANRASLTLAEMSVLDDWRAHRRRLIEEPIDWLLTVAQKDGPETRQEVIKTLEYFADDGAKAEVLAAAKRIAGLRQTAEEVKKDLEAMNKRLERK